MAQNAEDQSYFYSHLVAANINTFEETLLKGWGCELWVKFSTYHDASNETHKTFRSKIVYPIPNRNVNLFHLSSYLLNNL